MQKTSTSKIPVGIKSLAEIMKLTESEIRFFPKLEELKEHIKNYNYGMHMKDVLIDNLSKLKECCKAESLVAYVEGVDNLIKAVQYRY